MASSRLVGIRAPLLLPDFNAAYSSLDQAPISPPRAALSPARPSSPGLQGLPLRPIGSLSPSRLVPAPLQPASVRILPAAPESVSSVPDIHLFLPTKAVPEATDSRNLDDVTDLISDETVTGAHILGAAVALLASTTEVRPEQEPSRLPQDASSTDSSPENVEAKETAVCLETASLSPEDGLPTPPMDSGVNKSSGAMPWWLAANAENGEQSNGAHESWWSQQVEAARAKEQEQEAKALQESLHMHKGPDAPYALEDADPLLGAASPSLGEPLGGGAWWSQLTKIPTEDWLHLEQPQNVVEEMQVAKVDEKPLEQDREAVLIEESQQAEKVEAAATDSRGVLISNFEDIVSPDALAAYTAEVPSSVQPLVSVTQGAVEAEDEGAAVAFADTLVEGAFLEQPASPVISVPLAADNGTDASLITSAILLAAEGLILDNAIAPSDLQLAPPAPEHQPAVELNSPVEKTEVLAALPIVVEDTQVITDRLSTDAPLTVDPIVSAPLTPAQPATESIELPSPGLLEIATESEAAAESAQNAEAAALPSPKSAVKEARARLKTIKTWRSSRPQTPTLTVPIALAPPSPSGLPSLSLVSGVFPTRGSPRVASSGKVDGSIWKTLQDMEWATESTADTFGRSSVAAHLAERHDESHG